MSVTGRSDQGRQARFENLLELPPIYVFALHFRIPAYFLKLHARLIPLRNWSSIVCEMWVVAVIVRCCIG